MQLFHNKKQVPVKMYAFVCVPSIRVESETLSTIAVMLGLEPVSLIAPIVVKLFTDKIYFFQGESNLNIAKAQ